jgi:uncharacterized membrane protein
MTDTPKSMAEWWTNRRATALEQISKLSAEQLREVLQRTLDESEEIGAVAPTLIGSINGMFLRKQIESQEL